MAKKVRTPLPWGQMTKDRDLSRNLRQIIRPFLIGSTISVGGSVLMMYSTSWYKLSIALLIPSFLVSLIFWVIASVAWIFWVMTMLGFFIEVLRRVNKKPEIRSLGWLLKIGFKNLFRGSRNLGEMAKIFLDYDLRQRTRNWADQQRVDRSWQNEARIKLKEYQQKFPRYSNLGRAIHNALKSQTIHRIDLEMLLLRIKDALNEPRQRPRNRSAVKPAKEQPTPNDEPLIIPKRATKYKKPSLSPIERKEPAGTTPTASTKKPLFDLSKNCLDWEALDDFDSNVIPEQHRTACSYILYLLAKENLGAGQFVHRTYNFSFIDTFLRKYLKNGDYDIDKSLKILLDARLIHNNGNHHNHRRGVDYYKLNLSPRGVSQPYDRVVEQMRREIHS